MRSSRKPSQIGAATVFHGDCLAIAPTLGQVDAIVCDPPYHLVDMHARAKRSFSGNGDGSMARLAAGFMGQTWDGGDIAFRPETWAAIGAALRPGGYLLAFGGTRTHHRIWCAIEDAGFVIQDTIMWLYGQGFPKGRTQLKPAWEPVIVAYKPAGKRSVQVDECRVGIEDLGPRHGGGTGEGTWKNKRLSGVRTLQVDECRVATADETGWNGNERRKPMEGDTRTGAALGMFNPKPGGKRTLRVDECRIGPPTDTIRAKGKQENAFPHSDDSWRSHIEYGGQSGAGRWPANVVHDGSDEVMEAFAAFGTSVSHNGSEIVVRQGYYGLHGSAFAEKPGRVCQRIVDEGSPARFFYQAKATKADRAGSKHPTVKPIALMRWLVRLVTPPGGTVLDPFAGSGTTGAAALAEGRRVILIEQQPEYIADIKRRLKTLQQIAKAAA